MLRLSTLQRLEEEPGTVRHTVWLHTNEGSLYLHIIIPLRIKAMNTRRVLQLTSAEQGGPLQSNWPSNFQGLQSQLPFPLKTHDLPKCFISRYG
ncbi:uncharacterized protein LOC144307985 isoform X2 [Canis aureus]